MLRVFRLLCFIFFLACSAFGAEKIVALLQIRNEEEVIEQFLRMMALHADSIVLLDDASEDDTVEIVKALSNQLPIVEIIENEKSAWRFRSEKDNREKLLLAGRRVGGTHFILLDADEMFAATTLRNNWLRNKILALKPGQTLRLPTVHPWDNLFLYRDDEQCNPTLLKWRRVYAFADDGVCSYMDNHSWHGSACIHVSREPEKMICKERVKSFFCKNLDNAVLHFKCVNLENLDIKRVWYICLEFIRLNETAASKEEREANAHHLNKVYNEYLYNGILSDVTEIYLTPMPPAWYGYDFFDGSCYTKASVKRLEEIEKWFSIYGIDYFKELDIWNVPRIKDL